MHESDDAPRTPRPDPARRAELEHAYLASGVGHHVINAFSAIVSNAELLGLSEDQDSDQTRDLTEIMIKSALAASTLTRRLIDHARKATALPERRVDFGALVETVVQERRAETEGQITWTVETDALGPIRGDRDQLALLLRALLDNAIEAVGAAGGSISLCGGVEDSGWRTLAIKDSGEGMDPSTRERAVEPFFTTKEGHSGIGLSIANGIWRRHGGTFSLRSEPSRGTEVRLTWQPPEPAAEASGIESDS